MTEEEKNTTLQWRTLYVFNKKSGKLVKSVEGRGRGMLMMWALQNISKSKVAVLVIKDTNEIEVVYTGREGFPKIDYLYKADVYLCLDNYIIDDKHIYMQGLLLDTDDVASLVNEPF